MFHAADRVLVAVMNNQRDFRLAQESGWYRVPVRHAPPSTTDAAVLAFYLTSKFEQDRWTIPWYAEVRGHEMVRRLDLFPEEPQHPRAGKPYYKLQIGPLIRREPPLPSLRWRRITFIETTWDRFTAAEEINDLYASGADGLYVTLKESGFFPERDYLLHEEDGATYRADLAIPCREGVVAVVLDDHRPASPYALHGADPARVYEAIQKLGGALPPKSS